MKKAGIVLIALGFYCVLFAFNMDIVVGTTYNIGLMNERQNVVYLSGIIFLAGIMLFGFGFSAKEESKNLKKFVIACFLSPVLLLVGIKVVVSVQEWIKQSSNERGTVTIEATGLIWQRCVVGQTWTGTKCKGEAEKFTWYEAVELTSNFASNWRLPTNEELRSLIYCSDGKYSSLGKDESGYICANHTTANSPTIQQDIFPNTPADDPFWSSSPAEGKFMWNIYFGDGYVYDNNKNYRNYVRLIRK